MALAPGGGRLGGFSRPGRLITEAAKGGAQDTRGLALTLAVYVLILAAKLAAWWVSGVMVLLAEALHTLSDIFVSGFLLVAAFYSRRQADATHMFGYGPAQNVAALVAAVLFISFTSFELYREAIPRLVRAQLCLSGASHTNAPRDSVTIVAE